MEVHSTCARPHFLQCSRARSLDVDVRRLPWVPERLEGDLVLVLDLLPALHELGRLVVQHDIVTVRDAILDRAHGQEPGIEWEDGREPLEREAVQLVVAELVRALVDVEQEAGDPCRREGGGRQRRRSSGHEERLSLFERRNSASASSPPRAGRAYELPAGAHRGLVRDRRERGRA